MKYNDVATQWAVDYLESHDCRLITIQKIVEPAHSIVKKISTSQGVFYLKQTPPALFIEADTITLLQAQGCQHIPTVIAKNDQYHCFLTTACGDVTLRALFSKNNIDMDLLGRGINHYVSIQRKLENDAPMLLASGLTASFLIAGLSAYQWLRGDKRAGVMAAMKTGVYAAAMLIPLQILAGDMHGLNTLEHQPQKVAAMEGVWETQRGVPMLLFAVPNKETRSNDYEIGIPKLASLIFYLRLHIRLTKKRFSLPRIVKARFRI